MGNNWVDACTSVLENFMAGTPKELENVILGTGSYDSVPTYDSVPIEKFSAVYAGALGIETALASALVIASFAAPPLWTLALPLTIDVIARCEDIKHGRKYAVADGEETRYASLPVGIGGSLKDWYKRRFEMPRNTDM